MPISIGTRTPIRSPRTSLATMKLFMSSSYGKLPSMEKNAAAKNIIHRKVCRRWQSVPCQLPDIISKVIDCMSLGFIVIHDFALMVCSESLNENLGGSGYDVGIFQKS